LVLTKFILSAHIRTTKESLSISTIFSSINLTKLAQRFSLSVLTIGQPYITAQDTAVNRINSLLQFIQEENEHKETSQKSNFFLAKQSFTQ
jgi:hypothetical protein